MKKYHRIAAFVLATALTVFSIPFLPQANASADTWQKGVSIVSRSATDFTSDNFKQSVRNAQSMGATYVTLIIPYIQSDYQSSDIASDWNTPSDATLSAAVDYIHGLGMKVIFKPHLEVRTGGWRALIEARDRNAWYANYSNLINHLGDIGRSKSVEEIVIGTELIGMASPYMNSDNTQRWVSMIASMRTHYSGLLTYSANYGRGINQTNEFEQIGFWDKLDLIGISAYWDLASDASNSVSSLKTAWQTIDQNQIQPLSNRWGKPVLFSEIGYRSVDGAHTRPWDSSMGGNYNAQEQVNDYQALLEYWNGRSYFSGVLIWDWASDPNYGGAGNTDYTPHNKPAETTIKQGFSQTGSTPNPTPTPTPPPPTTPPPAPTGNWSSSATGGNTTVGSSAAFNVSVSNSGTAQDIISDVEIYDSNNSKVFQKFFEHQNFSNSTPIQYSVNWTPSTAGNYTLKLGEFRNDWGANYYWNDKLLAFTVAPQGQTPPPSNPPPPPPPQPTSYVTDIWWPTDGVNVGGTQPFKAMLENKPISEYTMYWQVDGQGLVLMSDSNQDYPHKEFIVDLSGWTWKGSGPYSVNFVSKDMNGNVISQKAVNIYVNR